jgi:hypothetical protein
LNYEAYETLGGFQLLIFASDLIHCGQTIVPHLFNFIGRSCGTARSDYHSVRATIPVIVGLQISVLRMKYWQQAMHKIRILKITLGIRRHPCSLCSRTNFSNNIGREYGASGLLDVLHATAAVSLAGEGFLVPVLMQEGYTRRRVVCKNGAEGAVNEGFAILVNVRTA